MTAKSPRTLDSAADVIDLVELRDIAVIELRAAHRTGLLLPQPAEEPPATSQVLSRVDDDVIDIRLVSTVESEEVRVSVDLLVQYSKKVPFAATDEAMSEFVQRVGFMAGYPYVREAVASMSTKLNAGRITLKVLRAEDVHFSVSDRDGVGLPTSDENGALA